MARKFLLVTLAVVFVSVPAVSFSAGTSSQDSGCVPNAGFLTRIGCLINLGVDAVSSFFDEGNSNPSDSVMITPGGEVRVNRASFEGAEISGEDEITQKLTPKGITDQEIVFQVPLHISTSYVIKVYLREAGQLKSTNFGSAQATEGEEANKICTSGAKRCSASEDGSQGFQECVRDSNPNSDTFKKFVWKGTRCASNEMCKVGSCVPIEDLSDYYPKDFGSGTHRTIVIDFSALKKRNAQMQAVGVDKLASFAIYDPNGEQVYWDAFGPPKTVQGDTLFTGEWNGFQSGSEYIPGKYSVTVMATRGNSMVNVEKVLIIDVPESKCSLLYGTGNSNNLDLMLLGDAGDGFNNKEDFINSVFSRLRPGDLANFDLVSAYSSKINLWGVTSPRDLGCKVEKGGALLSPLVGLEMVECDKDRVSEAAKTCPQTDIMAVITPETGGVAAARTESRAVVEKALQLGNALVWPVTIFPMLLYGEAWGQAIMPVNEIKSNFIWFEKDWTNIPTFWHEMGHAFAGIIDYYLLERDCKDFPSAMCDPDRFPYFSDQKASHDKYLMVTELNKSYCAGTIEASRPYPNPYNPTTSNPSLNTVKVQVRAKYPSDPNENTCYATFEVFNLTGQLVRSYVSKDPLLRDQYGEFKVPTPNYIFEWDGKDMSGSTVASGAYFFKVAMHNTLTQNSQDGNDLKIVIVK